MRAVMRVLCIVARCCSCFFSCVSDSRRRTQELIKLALAEPQLIGEFEGEKSTSKAFRGQHDLYNNQAQIREDAAKGM